MFETGPIRKNFRRAGQVDNSILVLGFNSGAWLFKGGVARGKRKGQLYVYVHPQICLVVVIAWVRIVVIAQGVKTELVVLPE